MAEIVAFGPKPRRPWAPTEIRVGIDFSRWCVAFYRGGRLYHRKSFDSETEARAEAGRLVATGQFVLGHDDPPGITYSAWIEADGGDCA